MTALEPQPSVESHGRAHRVRRPRALLGAAAGCLLSFTAFWVAQRLAHVTMVDLMVYRAEGGTARSGGDLYDMVATSAHLQNTYPPFAALLFTPLTLVGVAPMRTLATAGNLLLLVAVVHQSLALLRPAAPRGEAAGPRRPAAHWAVTLAVSAGAVWCEPVWTTLRYGQINLLLAALVLWDVRRRPGSRLAGVGTGIAAGVKLTPALFVVWFALVGVARAVTALRSGTGLREAWNPWLRRACTATVTFLATVGVGAALLPHDSRRFWTEVVFATDRVGDIEITADQSLHGAFARLLHTPQPGPVWSVAAVVVAALGLWLATATALRADRSGGPGPDAAWATVTCAVTALLVSPISWSHHWVWGAPMVVVAAAQARHAGGWRRAAGRRWWAAGAGLALALCSFALWWVPHRWHAHQELHQGPVQLLLSDVYPLAGLGFLAMAAVRLRAGTGRAAAAGPQARTGAAARAGSVG
ncbi:glycosyltransferase 87 family protein [Streptomyces sp. NPDC059740]|uniref:glycosyltransferase 87 family protein n=1 Tax=Streptomyces sp. NPDC059740 TaxID=3346926 RepID=UPI00365C0253